MKDENQDYEVFYCLSSGRYANIIYCLDASPFSQDLFFRSSFGSLTYPDMLLLLWESLMQEAVSIAGDVLLGLPFSVGERPCICHFLFMFKYFSIDT